MREKGRRKVIHIVINIVDKVIKSKCKNFYK